VFLNESATPTSTFRFGSGSPKTNNKTLTSAFRFGSGSSKTNSEIQLLLFDLEAKRIVEVDFYFSFWQRSYPKRIVNSNFCYSIWKPKRILEVDFRFSFWSGSSKTNKHFLMPSSKCSLDSFLIGFTGVLSHVMDLTDHWFHSNIHHTPDFIYCLFMLMFCIDCCKMLMLKYH